MLKTFLILIAACNILACAKKTQKQNGDDRTARLESAQAKAAQKISAQGLPSSAWSHEQLNQYEKQLDHLEQLDRELHGSDVASANTNYFANLRNRLAQARAAKFKRGSGAPLSSSNI